MRPKLVAALLAIGILLLGGGGVFVATRPTWRPAKPAAAKASTRALTGTGAAATAGAVNLAASAAASARHTTSATHGAGAARARTASAHRALSAQRSHAAGTAKRTRSKPAITYTVKAGDTLSGIAKWFKLHGYGGLYAANRSVIGSNPNLIFVGERITIRDGVMSLHAANGQNSSAS